MVTEEYECSMTLALISFLLEAVEVLVRFRSWVSLTFRLPATPSSLDIKNGPSVRLSKKMGLRKFSYAMASCSFSFSFSFCLAS
ncbi:hypothetical protein VVDAL7940_00197 [Vibrio vulnificus]|nr:hypothetical protein VVDAL7940_00197 [Vibrio vulnificus]